MANLLHADTLLERLEELQRDKTDLTLQDIKELKTLILLSIDVVNSNNEHYETQAIDELYSFLS